MPEYNGIAEQIDDALREFVHDDPQAHASLFVMFDRDASTDKVTYHLGVTGYDENIQSAIGHLLCSFALRTRDPEGWMASMFIEAFKTMKSKYFAENVERESEP